MNIILESCEYLKIVREKKIYDNNVDNNSEYDGDKCEYNY